jgi:hypothetical protein
MSESKNLRTNCQIWDAWNAHGLDGSLNHRDAMSSNPRLTEERHMTRHRVVLSLFLAASTAIVPEAGAAVISQVVFSDSTYADADWTIVNQFGLISAGQQPTGGHPGSYRQVALGVGQNVPFVGQLNKTFVYDPSVSGAITGITYNIDLETTNAEGATYFALLSQNGNLYVETMHTGNASPNTWLNENIVLDLADFALLRTNTQGNALIIDPNSRPDFSAGGSPITFGYEVTAGVPGSLLRSRESTTTRSSSRSRRAWCPNPPA